MMALALAACNPAAPAQDPPPADLAEPESMVRALVGIHILEQQLAEARVPRKAKTDSFRVYQLEILQAEGLDSARYYRSYAYYSQHPERLQEIMTAVTDSLGKLREEMTPKKQDTTE
jgi:hypothetical protein